TVPSSPPKFLTSLLAKFIIHLSPVPRSDRLEAKRAASPPVLIDLGPSRSLQHATFNQLSTLNQPPATNYLFESTVYRSTCSGALPASSLSFLTRTAIVSRRSTGSASVLDRITHLRE